MLNKHLFLSLLMAVSTATVSAKPIMHIGLTQVKTMPHIGAI